MGALILSRRDDGSLEIERADDEIDVADELLEALPPGSRLDGHVLKIDAHNGSVAYLLTDHDRLLNRWRAVRTKDQDLAR